MNQKPRIKFTHLPEPEEIRALESDEGRYVFAVPADSISPYYLTTLKNEFVDKHVGYSPHDQSVHIYPAILTAIAMDNMVTFYRCVEKFEKLAHELMQRVGETYKIDITDHPSIHHLKSEILERQRGRLGDEWKFRFHGIGCFFKNVNTGQTLDVFVNAPTHFGAVDPYYLMQFINTTEGLEDAATLLENQTASAAKVIELMKLQGFLIPIEHEFWKDKLTLNHSHKPDN